MSSKIKHVPGLRLFLIMILMAAVLNSCNNGKKKFGEFERIDPELNSIIGNDAKIEIIADGHEWTEGPLWVEEKKFLLYSDIPRNSIYKWTREKGSELYLKPSGYTGTVKRGGETGSNGLLLNNKSQLVLCQHGDRRMALMDASLDQPKPIFITLADNYAGKKFDSPNDAVFRSNGDLFFTDPPYGLEKNVDDPAKAAPYQGVYKLSVDGKVTLLTDTITRPNGIAFFPGEKTILIGSSDPEKAVWYAFDMGENDSLTNSRIFFDATPFKNSGKGSPDGMKIDKGGNVFATGPGGIWIFNKNGKVLGKIKIPESTSNCALADNDKTLYVTADMYVLKITMR